MEFLLHSVLCNYLVYSIVYIINKDDICTIRYRKGGGGLHF